MIKKLIVLGWVVILPLFAAGQDVLDGVVAIVGDEIILRSELLQVAQVYAIQMGLNLRTQTEEVEKLKGEILQNLIHEKVYLSRAGIDSIEVTDQQVEAALDGRIQEMVRRLGSQEKVEESFGAPIQKIKRDYRDDIRKQLIVQGVQQNRLKDVTVSRHDVETFFSAMKDSLPEQQAMAHLRHILMLVKPGGAAKQRAVLRMRDIQEMLKGGADFEELAKQYSEDPGSAKRGGNLGFVERGMLFQSFEEVAFQLEPGQVSDIVETPVGLHLIQLVEKRGDKASMRHILIRVEAAAADEIALVDTLNHIRERVMSGEAFETLAQTYSDDESTKEQGGDLGWLPLEQMQVEAFKTAVDSMEVGEVSAPFKTQFGYHIVLLEGKRGARPINLQDDWIQIQEWALNQKRQKVLDAWVKEIEKDVYIEIKDDLLK